MNKESGRSMVEMLGVLAIIGVLSAGALAGYSKAMFQHKMNKTIEEATKIFQRFEELVHKDWGNIEERISIDSETAVQYGLLEKCDFVTNLGCRLPIGYIYVDLIYDLSDSSGCSVLGHYGELHFYFTSAKECIVFASVPWAQMLPIEWWTPKGYIAVEGDSSSYLYDPHGNGATLKTTMPTVSEATSACESACINGRCKVVFAYRSYDC